MSERRLRFVVLPFIGAAAFWLPDTLTHLVRNTRFDTPDVVIITALMPVSLFVAWFAASRTLRRNMSTISLPFLCGIWLTGGLFMSIGWILSVDHPLYSVSLSTVLGIVPIYTFMAAAHDGSLFALLFGSVMLFVGWLLPMAVGKVQPS